MKLIPEWKVILKRAYSVRWLLVGAMFTGLEATLPFFTKIFTLSTQQFAALTFIIIVGAFVSRFVLQRNISGGSDGE